MLVGELAQQAIHMGELSVHVLHDTKDLNVRKYRGVTLHQLRTPLQYNPSDGRWAAYAQIIDDLRSGGVLRGESCIFAIDLGDVRIVGNLSTLCSRAPVRDVERLPPLLRPHQRNMRASAPTFLPSHVCCNSNPGHSSWQQMRARSK